MSDKRYPTRLHEVLGVAENEEFYSEDKMLMRVNRLGRIERKMDTHPCGWDLMCNTRRVEDCINHGITRRPRLTEEQVRVLEALYEVFDFKWLVKQKDGQVMAYANRPNKADGCYGCWFSGEGENEEDYGWIIKSSSPVCSLVSWSDPEPLDIVQVLRENGCEVDDA